LELYINKVKSYFKDNLKSASGKTFIYSLIAVGLVLIMVSLFMNKPEPQPVADQEFINSSFDLAQYNSASINKPQAAVTAQAAVAEPKVDFIASATRFKPISGDNLLSIIAKRLAPPPASTPYVKTTIPVTGIFNPKTLEVSGAANIPAWKQINSDVVAWIKFPGTNISWPVVVGPDNLYYAERNYYKQHYERGGVVWADSDNHFGDRNEISRNNVVYGHNWIGTNAYVYREGDVLTNQINNYFYDIKFAKEYPYFYYSTEKEEMLFKIFAVMRTHISFNHLDCNPDDATFMNIVNTGISKSIYKFDVDVNKDDKIVSFSTCVPPTLGKDDNYRLVIMGRLVRKGEPITAVNVTAK